MDAKVIVVILTYNLEAYVAEAIESVLAQKTDFPYKLLIADDASTDRTQDIIRKYQKKYPKKIELSIAPKTGGCLPNTIRAFHGLDADYFSLLDGDDVWKGKERLQHQVEFLEAHPDYMICSGQTQLIVNGKPDAFILPEQLLGATYTFEDFFKTPVLFHVSGLLYRNVIYRHGMPRCYFELVNTYRDCALRGEDFRRAEHLEHGPLYVLPELVSMYRIHAKGLWTGSRSARRAIESAIGAQFFKEHYTAKYPDMQAILEQHAEKYYGEMWQTLIGEEYVFPNYRLDEKDTFLLTNFLQEKGRATGFRGYLG